MKIKDKAGYPTGEALAKIAHWDWLKEKNIMDFVDFVKECWNWPDRFVVKKEKKKVKLYLSTGGWSGNEDIMRALRENFFWFVFWQKSIRGGHYWFEIPMSIIIKKEEKC